MTPELRELLKRHPAPWGKRLHPVPDFERGIEATRFDYVVIDANGNAVTAIIPVQVMVELVNDYAARISAGERFISGGGDG